MKTCSVALQTPLPGYELFNPFKTFSDIIVYINIKKLSENISKIVLKILRLLVTFIISKYDNKLYPPGSGSMWTSTLATRPNRRRCKVRLWTMALADFATTIPNVDIFAQVWSSTIEWKLGDYCCALCWTVSIFIDNDFFFVWPLKLCKVFRENSTHQENKFYNGDTIEMVKKFIFFQIKR